jgi:hypothetical protein
VSEKTFPGGSMLVGGDFKPGDQAPRGYLDWQEWAEVQHKAGLRQRECGKCGLWRYPQELSAETVEWVAKTSKGQPNKCSVPLESPTEHEAQINEEGNE